MRNYQKVHLDHFLDKYFLHLYYMSSFSTQFEEINARKIQRLFRKNNILKNSVVLRNEMKPFQSTEDFDKFTKFMRQSSTIKISEDLIKSFSNYKSGFKLTAKVMLTGYLIKNFSEELLGKEQHPMDKGIYDWSQELVKRLDEINDTKEVDKLWLLLNNYQIIFSQWKESDKSRMIESIIITYYNRSKHIEKIHADEKISKEEKEIIIAELNKHRQQVVGNIRFIDPEFNVEYFLENYEEVYNNMNSAYEHLTHQIGNTMKKAYFDMLCQEIAENNLLPIAELMTEISKRLIIIVPEKRREKFAEKINVNVIVELLAEQSWTTELKDYLQFICESVFMLGAQCDDEENKKWLKDVETLMESNYNNNLPLVLIQIEEKLDRIYQLINDLNQNK